MEYDSYEDLQNGLKNLPMTWYPALILVMCRTSLEKKVWKENGLTHFIRKLEKNFYKEK